MTAVRRLLLSCTACLAVAAGCVSFSSPEGVETPSPSPTAVLSPTPTPQTAQATITYLAKGSGMPMAGLTVYSTYQGLVVDTEPLDEAGGARVDIVEGGEITATGVTSQGPTAGSNVALSLGFVHANGDYTLVWPWGTTGGPVPALQTFAVTLSESIDGFGRIGAGLNCMMFSGLQGTAGSFLLFDSCRAPNGSALVYAEDLDGTLHGTTLVAAGSTSAHVTLVAEPRSSILHVVDLPPELAMPGGPFYSEVIPLHLSQRLAYSSILLNVANVTDSVSAEHFVHLSQADELLAYLYAHKDGTTFMSLRQVPVVPIVSFDDLATEFCPFGTVDASPGTPFGVSWSNACTEGTVILAEVREGGHHWIGIFPVGTESAQVPPIPSLVFTSSATVGATFLRHDPPLAYDDFEVWRDYLPPIDGFHTYNRTSLRMQPGRL